MSCKQFLKQISYKLFLKQLLKFAVRLIKKSMDIYQAIDTFSQSRNQLQNKNIQINFFISSLWQMQ